MQVRMISLSSLWMGLTLATVSAGPAHGQTQAKPATSEERPVEADGTTNVPAFQLPPSVYLSEAAKQSIDRNPTDYGAMFEQFIKSGRAPQMRASARINAATENAALSKKFEVRIEPVTIAGVEGVWVRSAARATRKVLINLPGGAFVMGTAYGAGMKESIPLAKEAGIDILSITYRQAPEATFPAASQDVTKVYRELLKTHRPQDIGIFGCSAGGLLVAQSLAWFQNEGVPSPGAAGIFCASADARWSGDSWYWQKPLKGLTSAPTLDERFYYGSHDLDDPLMSPITSDQILARFPPTLLITASRAGELSAAINTHRLLVRNGVDASLHVWDGLNHAFFLNTDLPESREAFDVMARFFNTHLGHKR